MPTSPHLAVRVPPAADEWIKAMQRNLKAPRSTVVRAMMRVAMDHAAEVSKRVADYKKAAL